MKDLPQATSISETEFRRICTEALGTLVPLNIQRQSASDTFVHRLVSALERYFGIKTDTLDRRNSIVKINAMMGGGMQSSFDYESILVRCRREAEKRYGESVL